MKDKLHWVHHYLFFGPFYIGNVHRWPKGAQEYPNPWRCWLMIENSQGAFCGFYPSEDEAKAALLARAEKEIEEGFGVDQGS